MFIRHIISTRFVEPKIVICQLQRGLTFSSRGDINNKMSNPQIFDHFFVMDFEATCLKDQAIEPQEVIEFPCLKVSSRDFSVQSRFHRYVRPVHHPNLSYFCTELVNFIANVVLRIIKLTSFYYLLSIAYAPHAYAVPNS